METNKPMTDKDDNETIKIFRDGLYQIIKEANEELELLRLICPHREVEVVNYEHKVGQILPTKVCKFCGKAI